MISLTSQNLSATTVKDLGRRLFLFQEHESWEQQAGRLLGKVFLPWLFWKCLRVVMSYNTSDYRSSRKPSGDRHKDCHHLLGRRDKSVYHFPNPCPGKCHQKKELLLSPSSAALCSAMAMSTGTHRNDRQTLSSLV